MSEPVYCIAPEVHQELKELRERLHRLANFSVLTVAQAKAQYWKRVNEVMREARIETSSDAIVVIECGFCSKLESIKRDVLRFNCSCSPERTQFTFQCRAFVA